MRTPNRLARCSHAVLLLALLMVAAWQLTAQQPGQPKAEPRFVDLSLLVAPEYPCNWPTWPRFQINHAERIGPRSPYNSDTLTIDGNTGTQLDVPPHSVALPETKLANSGRLGRAFTDRISAWQFGGEACIIDCRDLVNTTPNGRSDLVKKERIMRLGEEASPARFRRRGALLQRLERQVLQAAPRGPSLRRRSGRRHGAGLAGPRSGLHGVSREPQGDDARHRQHQHGPAARPRRADPLRGARATA